MKIFKTHLIVIILSFLTIQVFGANLSQIEKSGKLRIGLTGDYPPLSYLNDSGQFSGFDVDMSRNFVNYLSEKTGVKIKVQYVRTTWSEIQNDLKSGKFDIAMGGVTFTKKRASQFLLSNPVLANGKIALTTLENSDKYGSLKAIDKSNVFVVENIGGTNESFAKKNLKSANIILLKNNLDTFKYLQDGKATVMITDLIEGKYRQKETKHSKVPLVVANLDKPFTTSSKVYMVNMNDKGLLKQINRWLKHNNDDVNTLKIKWGL